MSVFPFPSPHNDRAGTVHVMGNRIEGFQVSHESASGGSWGELHGPYVTGQEAIAAAYALNRDQYGGECNVSVCEAAQADEDGAGRGGINRGDF